MTIYAVAMIGCGLWIALSGWWFATVLGMLMGVVGGWAIGAMMGVTAERRYWGGGRRG